MDVPVSCKNDKDPFKMKQLECSQHFCHDMPMEIFSDDQGQLTLQSISRSGRILNTSKTYGCLCYLQNEDDPIKNESTKMFTTLYINFSDTQGQITGESVVVSGQILKSSKLSKYMWIFFKHSMAANSTVLGPHLAEF